MESSFPPELCVLLSQFSCPALLVNQAGNIVSINGKAQVLVTNSGIEFKDKKISDVSDHIPEFAKIEDVDEIQLSCTPVASEVIEFDQLGAISCQIIKVFQDSEWFGILLLGASESHDSAFSDRQRLTILTDRASAGIVQTDAKLNCVYANSAWQDLSGGDVDASAMQGWLNGVDQADKNRVVEAFKRGESENQPVNVSFALTTPNGTVRQVECVAQPMHTKTGKHNGFLATFTDITSFHQAQSSLKSQAYFDKLTKLPNRNLFKDRLAQACKRIKRAGNFTLMLVALDGLDAVESVSGIEARDNLLQLAANRIKKILREHDTLARFGGDEFVVLAESIHAEADAIAIAEKLIAAIGEPFEVDADVVSISSNIGLTIVVEAPSDTAMLLRRIDIAMYAAKRTGAGQYSVFKDVIDSSVPSERLSMSSVLKRAIEDNEFQVYYQPQINVTDHSIFGYEALLRLQHPDRGWVSPSQFIPLLEESGMINKVGKWVLNHACKQFQSWREQHLISETCRLSVNLSPQQLWRTNIVQTVKDALRESNLPASCLTLEIVESVILQNSSSSKRVLEQLKSLGVLISLDDFGTGYSSLSYLKQFPVDEVKIDQSFVSNLIKKPDNAAIITAIIGLAHSFNIDVVAEGVDSSEKCKFLEERGCVIHQGYYFGYPIAVNDQFNKEQWNEIFRVNPLL